MTSLNQTSMLSIAGDLRFDAMGPDVTVYRTKTPFSVWPRQLRYRLRPRGVAHALLADARGVWAWAPGDCYAAPKRHSGVRDWMRSNPGSDVRLWVSAELTRSIEDIATLPHRDDAGMRSQARQALVDRHGDIAATWPLATWRNELARGVVALAGIDLDALRRHGAQNDVRIRSVEPWWHHAYVEAKRCAPALARASNAHVCVVEGLAAAWITLSNGMLNHVSRCVLEAANVDALCATIARMRTDRKPEAVPTLVLGQGLVDGGDTRRIDAFVLGRLDGDRPPQWLRPCTQAEIH
jgi:hypothetical protein